MPMYTWVRVDTEGDEQKQYCEVVRSFDDYEVGPTDEEYPDASNYKWTRVIRSGTMVRKGAGWGSGKGNW